MASTYNYRFIKKSSWGIAVDFTAEPIAFKDFEGKAIPVAKDLWFAFRGQDTMPDELCHFVKLGLRYVANQVGEKLEKEPVVINVLGLDYNPTDFQPEGIACATAGWLIREFKLKASLPEGYFDREKNRYVFDFSQAGQPLTQDQVSL